MLTKREKEILTDLIVKEWTKISRGLPKPKEIISVSPDILESLNKAVNYKIELEQLLTKLGSD